MYIIHYTFPLYVYYTLYIPSVFILYISSVCILYVIHSLCQVDLLWHSLHTGTFKPKLITGGDTRAHYHWGRGGGYKGPLPLGEGGIQGPITFESGGDTRAHYMGWLLLKMCITTLKVISKDFSFRKVH